VGDVSREPELRKDLGLAYLELEEYDRAYEVLRPALDMSSGQPVEAEVLLAMGRVLVVRRETVQAISLFEAVEMKNPDLIYKDAPTAWNVGLAFEGIGRYNKARTIYNGIRQKWPGSAEAGWASARLSELAALAQ
jgi:tetratricopeptide (TPR) repeat protein